MNITQEIIQEEYALALADCAACIPLSRWKIKPKVLKLTKRKRVYGMATIHGEVLINEAFIGTTAINQLRKTIRHELAHLTVGLHHRHNHVFQQCAKRYGARDAVATEETLSFQANQTFKWQLMAHLENGEVRDLGGRHRRSKRYTHYPQKYERFLLDKSVIARFEYIENS
ncbi:hypothetical protein [Algicola sagamiensis]|uniref:hypothetical protein n=1 Tax=Algicola sagamiensis TaxID=163869 RepID=UPI00035E8D73|nr:hypothetical protein [Algicola sagamiensis]